MPGLLSGVGWARGGEGEVEHRTSNIEHRTYNIAMSFDRDHSIRLAWCKQTMIFAPKVRRILEEEAQNGIIHGQAIEISG